MKEPRTWFQYIDATTTPSRSAACSGGGDAALYVNFAKSINTSQLQRQEGEVNFTGGEDTAEENVLEKWVFPDQMVTPRIK
jgi:hypothetical protein